MHHGISLLRVRIVKIKSHFTQRVLQLHPPTHRHPRCLLVMYENCCKQRRSITPSTPRHNNEIK